MPANYKPFDKEEWLRLEKKADELRRLTVQTTVWGGSGHIGGAMSAMDAMTILYHRFMKLDVTAPVFSHRVTQQSATVLLSVITALWMLMDCITLT